MKVCNKCKEEKELDAFAFRNKEKGTRHSICKQCANKWKKQHDIKNRDKILEYHREYYKKNREDILFKIKKSNIMKGRENLYEKK